MDATKCVICLEHASTMVPLDTEMDVDGRRISCEAMYGSITGITIEISQLNTEHSSLKLCLACFTQLNDCFLFQKQAIQSAETLLRLSTISNELTERADLQEVPEDRRTEICTNLEVDILDEEAWQHVARSSPPNSPLSDGTEEEDTPKIAEHGEQKPACEECAMLRANTRSFRKHYVRAHCRTTANDCFQCTVCWSNFRSMCSFIRHIRTHLDRKQFVCQFCPKAFHYLHHLQIHERTHTLEKPYHCAKCPKAFAAKDRLVAHERATHEQHAGVPCDLCQKRFQTNKSLLKHKLIKHDRAVESKRFTPTECDRCGKVLLSQSAFTYHMRHTTSCCTVSGWDRRQQTRQQVTIGCDRCKERFLTVEQLEAHLKTEHGPEGGPTTHSAGSDNQQHKTPIKPKYQCDVCGIKFKQHIVLVRHKQRHDGIRPYRCEVCDRSFTQKGTLKTHMRRHTDEKPYECERCGVGFHSAASRRSHYMRQNCRSAVVEENDVQ